MKIHFWCAKRLSNSYTRKVEGQWKEVSKKEEESYDRKRKGMKRQIGIKRAYGEAQSLSPTL